MIYCKEENKNNFIKLIRSVFINNEKCNKEELPDLNIELMIKYAKFHSLEYITYLALINNGFIDPNDEQYKKFIHAAKVNAYKCVTQDVEFDLITNEFEKNGLKFLPLKGSIIRKMYPAIEYRSMADIDILVLEKEMDKAGNILKSIGYFLEHGGGNHDSYMKKPYMNIEVHRALIDESNSTASYYNDIWSKVLLCDDKSYCYKLSDDDYLIFLITHAAKHFSHGGTGFRTIIDIYIYLSKVTINEEYVFQELKKLNLSKFGQILIDISNYIFTQASVISSIEDICSIIEFILDCGTYGTINQHSVNEVAKERDVVDLEKSKVKVIINRLLPPYKIMKRRNPILKKIPILLPWFWFTRLLKGLFNHKEYKKQYNIIKDIKEEDIDKAKKIHDITGV